MKIICNLGIATLAALCSVYALAQTTVYESRDAEGNVSFSDESSANSVPVDIQKTTVVDAPPPEQMQSEPPQAAGASSEAPQPQGGGTQYMEDDGDDYVEGDDYLADDPRLRRAAVRNGDIAPGVDDDMRRDAAVAADADPENVMEEADRAAERSDITGPDAEYRDTAPREHVEGRR